MVGDAGCRHSSEKTPVRSLLAPEIEQALAALGQPAYRAKQVLRWLYEKRVRSFEEMTDLPGPAPGAACRGVRLRRTRAHPQDRLQRYDPEIPLPLADANLIESVLIPASPALYGEDSDRRTLCVSTQVGCAYGCKFCASGLDGWTRNLHAGEIVEQLGKAEALSGERVNNIVSRGWGSRWPITTPSCGPSRIINAPWGIHLGARHITVSTSGWRRASASWPTSRSRSGSPSPSTARPTRSGSRSCR